MPEPAEGAVFPWLEYDQDFEFPPGEDADEDGLVGVGGNLSPGMLVSAYRRGLFPWFSRQGEPYWFCPDPRFVLMPEDLHVGETIRKILRRRTFSVTFDNAFSDVMTECSRVPRPGQDGTWITPDFLKGYGELHRAGLAHSVEVWSGEKLAGGLYGVLLGRVFYGESMFSLLPNASKVGFVTLVRYLMSAHSLAMVDCQAPTEYLRSFGAREVARDWFLERLREWVPGPDPRKLWSEVGGGDNG